MCVAGAHTRSMSHTTLLRAIALGALSALIPAASAHAAPTRLSTEQAVAPVAAWNGAVAWSSLDVATKQFRLVLSKDGGAPAPLNVAASSSAFDVDLGTSRQGATQAVYTRGGDVYRYSLAGGAETRLSKLSAGTVRLPTIQRGEIAFVRAGKNADLLQIGNTTSGFKAPRTLVRLAHSRGRITGTELSWDRIAYVVGRPGRKTLHVRMLRSGKDRVVLTARSGGLNEAALTRPSLTEDQKAFVLARTNNVSGVGNNLIRYDIASGDLSYARGSSRYLSAAWVGPSLGVATFSDDSGTTTCFGNINDTPDKTRCHVDLSGPVVFE